MTARATLLRRLLPGYCLLCDAALPADRHLDLCLHCAAALPWNRPACARCALPLTGIGATLCATCRRGPPPFLRALAPLRFEDVAGDWVRRTKDRMGMVEGHLLGTLLADHVAQALAEPEAPRRPDLLIPVPLAWRRLARRGHNQALTLALPLARRLGIPVWRHAVLRRGARRPQRGLSRIERLANPAGRFHCRRRWDGECIGIVDDVMTTGATVTELTRVLLAAGAGPVYVLCAARTP